MIITVKNKYFVRSRILEAKFRENIRYFATDLTATQIASLTKLNLKTINKILKSLRQTWADFCDKESVFESGKVEIDEGYFQARRVKGKRVKGVVGKTVFRFNHRNEDLYRLILATVRNKTLKHL